METKTTPEKPIIPVMTFAEFMLSILIEDGFAEEGNDQNGKDNNS